MYSAATRAICFARLLLPLGLDYKQYADVSGAVAIPFLACIIRRIGPRNAVLLVWRRNRE